MEFHLAYSFNIAILFNLFKLFTISMWSFAAWFFPGKSSEQLQATVVLAILCRDFFQLFLFFRSLRRSLFVGVEKMFRVFYDCSDCVCFKIHVEVLFFRPFQQFLLLNGSIS